MPRNPYNKQKGNLTYLWLALLLGMILFFNSGCASASLADQARLSRSGMLFSDAPTLADSPSLLATVEPGTDDRGGAAASGCTACR